MKSTAQQNQAHHKKKEKEKSKGRTCYVNRIFQYNIVESPVEVTALW